MLLVGILGLRAVIAQARSLEHEARYQRQIVQAGGTSIFSQRQAGQGVTLKRSRTYAFRYMVFVQ